MFQEYHCFKQSIDNLPSLIRTFFGSNGGYHLQFNVIGKETFCAAQKNPDEYRGLIVRIV